MKQTTATGKILGLLLAGLGAAAASADALPDAVNGVVTVPVDAGVTNTYDDIPAGVTRLVKTGAGGAIFATAASVTSCDVDIQDGTLILKEKTALGTKGTITVKSGATLHTNFAGSKQSVAQLNQSVHIAGTGVNGLGAIRHTNPTKSNSTEDTLFYEIQLDANAKVEAAHRWGVRNLYLNKHTLTRSGSGEWNLYYTKPWTPGDIVNTIGTLILQDTQAFPKADGESSLTMTGGSLSVYSCKTPLNLTLYLKNDGGIIWGGSTSTNQNVIAGNMFTSRSNYAIQHKCLNITGNFINTNSCSIYFKGGSATSSAQGNGLYGTTYFRTGSTAVNFCPCLQNHLMILEEGTTLDCDRLRVGNLSTRGLDKGAVRQMGGTVSVSDASAVLGEQANGGYGAWALENGTMTCRLISNSSKEGLFLARWATNGMKSVGMIVQKGGLFNTTATATNVWLSLGYQGIGYYVQTGGTHDYSLVEGNQQKDRLRMGNLGGTAVLSVSGTSTVFKTAQIVAGNTGKYSPQILLAVSDGGTLEATRVCVNHSTTTSYDEASTSCFYFARGVFRPTYTTGISRLGIDDDAFTTRNPNHVILGKGGLIIDTSKDTYEDRTTPASSSQIPWAFEAPQGKGIASITLPDYSTLTTTNKYYMGAVPLIIEGSGYGAAAYADYDYDTGTLKPVIISPGCNYDENTKIYLPYANFPDGYDNHRLACTYTLEDNDTTGGLTIRGSVPVYLKTANTYKGATVLESGSLLKAYSADTLPEGTDYTVASGATLDLNGNSLVMNNLAGAGAFTNASVTVTNELRVAAADIFSGKYFTTQAGASLSLADTAKFAVTDASDLESYLGAGMVYVVKGTLLGKTPERPSNLSTAWRLVRTNDGLMFGVPSGTVFLLR